MEQLELFSFIPTEGKKTKVTFSSMVEQNQSIPVTTKTWYRSSYTENKDIEVEFIQYYNENNTLSLIKLNGESVVIPSHNLRIKKLSPVKY